MQHITHTERALAAFDKKLVGLREKEWRVRVCKAGGEVFLGVILGLDVSI